ncbi:MAG: SMC-Scp complex subunit ScpB [Cellvibrionaceae bacterium]
MKIDSTLLRKIVEGALLASGGPLSLNKIAALFEPAEGSEPGLELEPGEKPSREEILAALEDIQTDCKGRGYELKEVGSGWRFQVVQETAPWINRLWEERPQKYSRALLETLALIAYRQPITRGDIEAIRGVAVSSNIIKTLAEREWVKVVGHRDVPGRPALYATTREFLDYFNLKSLDELPSLKEIKDFDKFDSEFNFDGVAMDAESSGDDREDDEGHEPSQAEPPDQDDVISDEAGEVNEAETCDDVANRNDEDDQELDETAAEAVRLDH